VANGFTINFGNIRFQSPWSCNIDTLRWLDGTHTLAARAYDANGNWQDSAPVSLTVSNGASASVTVPSLPARHSWVKLGVTSESSPDSSMQAAVLNDVSWAECTTTVGKVTPSVVNGWCDAASVSRIGTIIYTNVNNLYSFFLWDWNRYADANSVSRELGFLHVCTPFAQTYTYASTVHRASSFWGCYLKTGAGPYTELLHDPDSPAVGKYRLTSTQTFAASVNDYLAIGYTERFRQIILTMVTPASGGWTYVIEYPNAVDGSSVPTSWGTITPTTDGTSGLTTSGTISFEPPSDWAGSSPDGRTDYLQWIRIRTTHTGTTPSTSAVYAEDYLGTKASSNAIVPVFDNQADANGDGYLNDTEYANRRSGMDARFNYWSRLNTAYGDGEPVTNMSESAYRDWVASYMGAIATSNGATGLFIDNATYNYGPGTMQGWRGRFSTVEPWDWMLADHGSACMRVWQVCAVSGGSLSFCVANVMGGGTLNDIGVATRCPALWREQLLRPLFDNATAMGTNRTVLLTDTSYHGGDCICLPGSKSEDSLFEAPGTVTGSPTSSSFVGSSDLDNVKTYATAYMQFTSGVLASSGPNQITTYTPSTRTFGFSTPWSQAPTAGDAFVISGMDAAGILYSYHVHSTPTALWTGLALYQDRRLQVSTAAYYYCVATPSSYLVPFNATASTPVQPVTARATAFNVGALTETTGGTPLIAGDNIGPKVWATGIDPYDGVSTYKVMIRHYANATILFRPYAAAQALAMGAPMGNTSAVSLSLTAEHSAGFKQVLFDGSLDSTVITSISLRNGEGAILVPQ
jgi:hypothetical protein